MSFKPSPSGVNAFGINTCALLQKVKMEMISLAIQPKIFFTVSI
jgi:hypothetical protein